MRKQNRKPLVTTLDQMESDMLKAKLTVPQYRCPGGNLITAICINSNCTATNALHCKNNFCSFCDDEHQCTTTIDLEKIIFLIDQTFNESRQLMSSMKQIVEEALQRIKTERISLYQKYLWAGKTLPYQFQETASMLRSNDPEVKIKPKQASALMDKLQELKQKRDQNKGKIQQLLKGFQADTSKIVSQLTNLQKSLIEELQDKENDLLSSQVINNQDQSSIRFIMKSLQYPRNLKLLFRASEHEFSAKKFHRLCDNVSHTLTLIKTDGGKTIGGFTPLKWESPEEWRCLTDHSRKSFLLSVDFNLKMPLVNPIKAIQCDKDWGPIFGGQNTDMAIVDNCFEKENSSFTFPKNYKLDDKYQGSKTFQKLTGDPSGFFKVKEYQVFKVHY